MDESEAYRRVWQTFRTFSAVADGRHDTPDWRAHDGVYALCGIRVPAASLQPALDQCRRALAPFPFARIHPDHFLHLTLQELGFVTVASDRSDEITPARLDELAALAAAATAPLPPFELRLGGVNSFQDAAFLDVHDRGLCAHMHHRLNDIAAVPKASRFAYLPHSTIAHYTGESPIDDLPAALAPWRDTIFGAVPVRRIEILTFRLDEPYPPPRPYAVIPLTG